MGVSYSREQHVNFTFENYVIGSELQTTSSTPMTMYSIPLESKKYMLSGEWAAGQITGTGAYAGDFQVRFDNSAGTVLKVGEYINEDSSYSGEFPKIEILPNVDTQSIDFVATGLPSTSINWSLKFCLKFRS